MFVGQGNYDVCGLWLEDDKLSALQEIYEERNSRTIEEGSGQLFFVVIDKSPAIVLAEPTELDLAAIGNPPDFGKAYAALSSVERSTVKKVHCLSAYKDNVMAGRRTDSPKDIAGCCLYNGWEIKDSDEEFEVYMLAMGMARGSNFSIARSYLLEMEVI
jgi:hypothetical protein